MMSFIIRGEHQVNIQLSVIFWIEYFFFRLTKINYESGSLEAESQQTNMTEIHELLNSNREYRATMAEKNLIGC